MKVTIENLVARGILKDVSGPIQTKKGTKCYRESKSIVNAIKNGTILEFNVYPEGYYRVKGSPNTISIENIDKVLYRALNKNYLPIIKSDSKRQEAVIDAQNVTEKTKKIIDNLTDEELDERDQYIEKLKALIKLYGFNTSSHGYGKIPYIIATMEHPSWIKKKDYIYRY